MSSAALDEVFDGLVGKSQLMKKLFDDIRKVGPAQIPVLILGETGTGKDSVARALHQHSPRRDGPFIPLNCAAIPETLVESELFGHEKGAFTGADQRKIGSFESANEG